MESKTSDVGKVKKDDDCSSDSEGYESDSKRYIDFKMELHIFITLVFFHAKQHHLFSFPQNRMITIANALSLHDTKMKLTFKVT